MISLKELNAKAWPLTSVQEANLFVLQTRMNVIREAWGKPMIVTSGFRSLSDHKRIYAAIAKRKGLATIRIPMSSKHLSAEACDIEDKDGSLMAWCKSSIPLLERAGLWLEDGTRGWVHFQSTPPASGKRFFNP